MASLSLKTLHSYISPMNLTQTKSIIAIFLLLLLLGCGQSEPLTSEDLKEASKRSRAAASGDDYVTYTNDEYGFSIDVPSNWDYDEDAETGTVIFGPPYLKRSGPTILFQIEVDELPENMRDLDKASDMILANMKKDGTIIETSEKVLSGQPARMAVREGTKEGVLRTKTLSAHYWTIGNGKVYIISFTVINDPASLPLADLYIYWKPLSNKAIQTFTIHGLEPTVDTSNMPEWKRKMKAY